MCIVPIDDIMITTTTNTISCVCVCLNVIFIDCVSESIIDKFVFFLLAFVHFFCAIIFHLVNEKNDHVDDYYY